MSKATDPGRYMKPFVDPAIAVTEAVTGIYAVQEELLRRRPGLWKVVREVAAGGDPQIPSYARVPQDALVSMVLGSAIDLMWRRTRTVYAVHPDMAAELTGSTSDVLAGSVFRHLPHTCPLLVFAEPLPTRLANGQPGRVYGVYVVGSVRTARGGSRYVSTDDEDMATLSLMIVTGAEDEAGRWQDWELSRVRVPLAERFTVADAIAASIAHYSLDESVQDGRTIADVETWLGSILPVILNTLLYACTDDADTIAVPAPRAGRKAKAKRGKDNRREKPTRVLKLGWRLGPALKAARAAARQASRAAAHTGRRLPPHQRRGHFKMVRYGPELCYEKPAYIKPYMVSLDLLAELGLDTRLIPVQARRTAQRPRETATRK